MSQIETITAASDPKDQLGAERASHSVNLTNRPDIAWLGKVEGELNDVDLVLKCLARDADWLCQTCSAADRDGVLSERPVLARCAGTKNR